MGCDDFFYSLLLSGLIWFDLVGSEPCPADAHVGETMIFLVNPAEAGSVVERGDMSAPERSDTLRFTLIYPHGERERARAFHPAVTGQGI